MTESKIHSKPYPKDFCMNCSIDWLKHIINIAFIDNYRVAQKKRPVLFFISKLCFAFFFFPYFSGGVDSRSARSFDTDMDPSWHYTMQQQIKIIETYFAAVMQERFWQEQCTWWKDNSTFGGQTSEDRKCGRWSQRPRLLIVPNNSWEYFRIYRNAMKISPVNQYAVFHKKLAFREHQFWGSSMMTLNFFLTKFRSCIGKLFKIK